jgi:hypothetical protein
MCHDDSDHMLRQLAECRDTTAMRRLLRMADPCHGCPDEMAAARDTDACPCRMQSRQDLRDRIYHTLSVPRRGPW